MSLLTIENASLRLAVAPRSGASVAALEARRGDAWLPILRPTPEDAIAAGNSSLFASFALVPWSNRVRDARFRFAGRQIALRPNTPEGHAIHGDVRKRPWRTVAHDGARLELAFDSRDFADVNFPWLFSVALTYALDGSRLTTAIALENRGDTPMPAGFGFHPYFRRTLLDAQEQVELRLAVAGVYRGILPTAAAVPLETEEDFRAGRAIGASTFDHCFAGWDGRAHLRWPGSGVTAEIEASEPFRHVILFVPPGQPFFAVEPVSHANDGFNLLAAGVAGSGVQVLTPGERLAGSFDIRVGV